jgi:UV DNA damage endonuclease
MSSEMFPFASHPDFYKIYDWERFRLRLQNLGELAKHYNQTITFHPGQYNQLTSSRESVVEKSIIDIDIHAKILDIMNCGNDGVIVIHGGSKADGKQVCLDRLCQNFLKLSKSSRRRLVLENCEMAYSIQDLLPVSRKLQVPIVIDYHHHNINPGSIENSEQLIEITNEVLDIWKSRDITPLFHLSESKPGIKITDSITARRAHSDYVENLPSALIQTLEKSKINLDIEAKMKEQAVLRLFKKYKI